MEDKVIRKGKNNNDGIKNNNLVIIEELQGEKKPRRTILPVYPWRTRMFDIIQKVV